MANKITWKCNVCSKVDDRVSDSVRFGEVKCSCGGLLIPIDEDGRVSNILKPEELVMLYKVEKKGCEPPKPESGEDKNSFISRCIKKLADEKGDEYDNDQRVAICYSMWGEKSESVGRYIKYICENCGYAYLVEESRKSGKIELCPRCFGTMKTVEQCGLSAGDYIAPASNVVDTSSYVVVRLDDVRLPLEESLGSPGFEYLKEKGISVIVNEGKVVALKFNKEFNWNVDRATKFMKEKWQYLRPELHDSLIFAPKSLRRLLNGRLDLIREWRKFYIEAFSKNVSLPNVAAWKRFNEVYEKKDGSWTKK